MTPHLRVLVLFSSCLCAYAVPNCPVGGVTIYFGNGILTTPTRADSTLWTIKAAVDHALDQRAPDRDPSCVKYELAYDSLFINSEGRIATALNAIGQIVVAAIQLGLTNSPSNAQQRLYESSDTVPSLPSSWGALGNTYRAANSIASVFQPDVQNHRARYQTELSNGNNVIVVAHSQGNLYVNQTFAVVTIPTEREFTSVAVASPANNVLTNSAPWTCGTGMMPCYLTLFNDVILLVPFPQLSPNVINTNNPDLCGPSISSMSKCHDMNKSYLLGDVTGPAIVNSVVGRVLKKLTIVESGAGSGTVRSTPVGIDCGLECEAYFYAGSTVSLVATPDPGSEFVTWSGDCSGTAETVTVNLSAVKTCTATYRLKTVTITKAGTGTGTVSSAPAGINCAPACPSQSAPFDGSVQLTAMRAPGSIFGGWGGDCAGAGTNTTAQVTTTNGSKTCTATFIPGGHLMIIKAGSGTGTVTTVPSGISCGASCTAFPATPPVQVTAAPTPGSTFSGWSGDCSGTALSTTVTMTADKSCTATFQSSTPAVRLNPFGMKNLSEGPFTVEVVNSFLNPVAAPRNITINLLREVVSPCRGVIFSSPRTFVISQGQSSSGGPDAAGRDPVCNASPTRTEWTITGATIDPGTPLDLSVVPSQQLFLSISR